MSIKTIIEDLKRNREHTPLTRRVAIKAEIKRIHVEMIEISLRSVVDLKRHNQLIKELNELKKLILLKYV